MLCDHNTLKSVDRSLMQDANCSKELTACCGRDPAVSYSLSAVCAGFTVRKQPGRMEATGLPPSVLN